VTTVPTLGASTASVLAAHTSRRFVDLEVNAGVVLHPNNAKECADRLGSVARATNHLAHVVCMEVERQKHTHLINSAADLNCLGVLNQPFTTNSKNS
jgi:hypothetical protein